KNDKSTMGNLQMAYDGWVNATGETARAKETMLNYIGGIASTVIPIEGLLLENANPVLTRAGQWHGHRNALMYISNGKMVVTEANGTFITVINKTANQWYNAAKKLR
ncbi:hypothetical protein ACUTSE_17980, partial [Myroides sp. TSA_177.3]